MSATVTETSAVPSTLHSGGENSSVLLQPLEIEAAPSPSRRRFSKFRTAIVTTQLSGVNFASSAVNGFVVVGLPAITADLQLPKTLAFWPASVASLATASTLLVSGAVADHVGPRIIDLVGCFSTGAMMIAAGSARTGSQLVALRALQGVGFAMHLASSVSILTTMLPSGRGRNIAFSCLGLSQVLGFSFGLVVGGLLQQTAGWRAGWYLSGALTLALSLAGVWAIPSAEEQRSIRGIMRDFGSKIDWVGVLLSTTFMTLLSYMFAVLSTDIRKIKEAQSIVLLLLSVIAAPCFVAWVHRQVQRGKPALIPNALWSNLAFSGMCATILLSFGVVNTMELFASLFFQEVQQLPPIQASLRILPSLVVAMILNFSMGLFVDRIPARWIVIVSSILCAGSPLLMAVIDPKSPYWANAFVAQLLQPISPDSIFTVGLIVITDVFPPDTQALAGAVFNTAAQFGQAFGLAIMQVVYTLVEEQHRSGKTADEIQARLAGLKASFWTMFGMMLLCGIIGTLSMRKTGRVGLKQD